MKKDQVDRSIKKGGGQVDRSVAVKDREDRSAAAKDQEDRSSPTRDQKIKMFMQRIQ